MSDIDFKATRCAGHGHLPCEMLADGKTVHALPTEFCRAIDLPDVNTMGSTVLWILCLPLML